MPIVFDRARIRALLHAIADELDGRWLLVGGAFAALRFLERRVTEDVDIMGMEDRNTERLQLLELAERHGLPVEALNSAADFFVRRIPNWENQIEVLHQGKRGTIYGPSVTLFVLLKMRRLSAQDLDDCQAALAYAAAHNTPVDAVTLERALADLAATDDSALTHRRGLLGSSIRALP